MSLNTISESCRPLALRLAVTAAALLAASFPVHFLLPPETNGIVMGVALGFFCGVIVLCVVARRFWPIALAIIGMILHAATLPAG
jgi:hypothetical protein